MFKIRPAWVLVCHASYVAFCHRAAESPISLPPCSFAALAAEIFVGNIVQCVSKLDNQWKKKKHVFLCKVLILKSAFHHKAIIMVQVLIMQSVYSGNN